MFLPRLKTFEYEIAMINWISEEGHAVLPCRNLVESDANDEIFRVKCRLAWWVIALFVASNEIFPIRSVLGVKLKTSCYCSSSSCVTKKSAIEDATHFPLSAVLIDWFWHGAMHFPAKNGLGGTNRGSKGVFVSLHFDKLFSISIHSPGS